MARTYKNTKSREERQQEQREALEAAARKLMTSDGWKNWVQANSKFHRYSPNNRMLIAMQSPEATRVASYRKWAAEFNRQVRKGEKAIKIFAPRTGKRTETDDDGKEVTRSWTYFVLVPVFDIAQTDGDPFPEEPVSPIEGDSHAEHIFPLVEWAQSELNVTVHFQNLTDDPRGGWFRPETEDENAKVVVDDSVSENQQLMVLVHELAHALGVDYEKYTRAQAEVIVESASYMVCGALGLDVGQYAAGYVASWGNGDDLAAMTRFAQTVDEVASKIEAALGLLDKPRLVKPEKEEVAA